MGLDGDPRGGVRAARCGGRLGEVVGRAAVALDVYLSDARPALVKDPSEPALVITTFTAPGGAEQAHQYYRARYYDPHVGRFIGEDPIGFEVGPNFYAYVDNLPANATDPFGLLPVTYPDPEPGGAGGGPPGLDETWSDWRTRGDRVGWRYAHCMASCESAKNHGQSWSNMMGHANEVRQTVRCKTLWRGDCASAWADQDFHDNETGYTCPDDKSCADVCEPLYGKNKTPDQFGPFYKGPR